MTIIDVNVKELIPYINNPRINEHAVDYVAASIKEFGFKQPIVIDKDNVIIAGHTRLEAAKKLKLETVPCVLADDLTEQQIKAYRLADNKVSEFALWDLEKLQIELEGIGDLDMVDFGFEDLESSFDAEPEPEEDSNEFDDVEKLDKHYGVPYQGNKSRIADIIINLLPAGKRLVDLFGDGGAITHCGLLADKWDEYLYNDINPMITRLFVDAINGKYHDERRVITREDFEALKDTDAFVKYIWSFGNNGTGYLWGKDIEELKQTACHALVDETITERRLAYGRLIRMLKGEKIDNIRKYELEPLERLGRVQELHALESLEKAQGLEVTNIDYHDYIYKDGDVVYCDIPYEQTDKKSCNDYGVQFDSIEFYNWAKSKDYQIFFSSYEISDNDFYKKKIKTIKSLIGATTNAKSVNEYLYSNKPLN